MNFEDREGPHPFTISSTWKDDGHLLFLIKGLGDYTRALPTTLKVGTIVTVEGPVRADSHSREVINARSG